MEFRCLVISFSILFFLALEGESHAQSSLPDEDFWHAIWPNTPIPGALRELLKRSSPEDIESDDLPMQITDTEYPKSFFYEQDLHPGKTMNVEFSKSPFTQSVTVFVWIEGLRNKDLDKEGYTFAEICMETKPKEGEHKLCAKSLETLIGFAISKLGTNIQVLSSSFVDKQVQYTIEEVQNLGDKAVMCHRLNFQRMVFYCHEVRATTAFMVGMVAGDGTKTQTLAICHSDTSGMNHHVLRQTMGVDPGTNTVCHFLGRKAILWVPNLASETAYQTV